MYLGSQNTFFDSLTKVIKSKIVEQFSQFLIRDAYTLM